DKKSKEELDNLDTAILESISSGKSKLNDLKEDINIRSEDLAFHLERLYTQAYIDYYIRSLEIYLTLTENGFNKIGRIKKETKVENKKETKVEDKKEDDIEETGMYEEMPKNREIQTKLTDVDNEDINVKMVNSKRAYYLQKYWLYYILVILLVLIIAGLFYIFFFMN
ncbi:MAG: hypothetical protein WC356_07625, partial [Candidatus Micrarchaeia archaeon]